jgi:carbonic anhydrase
LAAGLAFGMLGLASAEAENRAPDWSYTGPGGVESWAEINPDYATCGMGQQQSPIDVGTADRTGTLPEVKVDYLPLPLTILHNGRTVEVVVNNGSRITLDGQVYELLQFHFHTPSEHMVDGIAFAMEVHFVHRAAGGGLAVIGVLVKDGGLDPTLADVIAHTPPASATAQTYPDVVIDPSRILPPMTSFWYYDGSLTTPPCSEGVRWMVQTAAKPMSLEQIATLAGAMGRNARPAQPVHGRRVVAPNP